MSRRGLTMSLEQATAHANRHGYSLDGADHVKTAGDQSKRAGEALALPKSRRNKTETEFSLILEAMRRRGEILEWRFEGMSLAWGTDPATGKPMWYTADFWVRPNPTFEDSEHLFERLPITLIEIKGPHIREKDLIRFKGCRACWPTFRFELHQRKAGQWLRIH